MALTRFSKAGAQRRSGFGSLTRTRSPNVRLESLTYNQSSRKTMKESSHISGGGESSENAQNSDLVDESAVDARSAEYLGQWEKLVSTTNWEKGRIICQWRQELLAAGAPLETCSDEAWSRRVGSVSAQHVGRLRRVYQRFGEIHAQFAGLYWSHFQAVLDWHDAEMWLEGAVQSGWSVARMRTERWQAMGSPAESQPRDGEVIAADVDEDADPANDSHDDAVGASLREVHDPGTDRQDEPAPWDNEPAEPADAGEMPRETPAAAEPVRPFENLPSLPRDLADAFEAFKLAILNHKLSGWREATADDVLTVLNALKQLALAPA